MAEENDIVTFLMPDGSEVSNDPRFQSVRETRANMVNWRENRGHDGYEDDELEAARARQDTGSIQSGQEGVGENATTRVPTPGLTGADVQVYQEVVMAADVAREKGLDENTELSSPEDLVDANEAVRKVAEEKAKVREATPIPGGNADDQIDEEPDPAASVDDLTIPQLKREAKRLGVEVPKGTKVSELRAKVKERQEQLVGGTSAGTAPGS